uniref:Uncharacterized protein n=1 Tax=Avena sativa TaxID=4498 RepID=A0ACD5XWJ1_AVESA
MATKVDPPSGTGRRNNGKHYYRMWQTTFEVDTKYVPIRPIGEGSYGTVCSSVNRETDEEVAIKKIQNVFHNRLDALRTLRELMLLRQLRHENVICLKDIMMPTRRRSFKDVYLVSELMETDLNQIIMSILGTYVVVTVDLPPCCKFTEEHRSLRKYILYVV